MITLHVGMNLHTSHPVVLRERESLGNAPEAALYISLKIQQRQCYKEYLSSVRQDIMAICELVMK